MSVDRRLVMVGVGGLLVGAAGAAAVMFSMRPGPGVAPRSPTADPHLPAEPGGPNAIGQLATAGGAAPPTPRVAEAEGVPRRLVVPFTLGTEPTDPGAGWPCMNAVGTWAITQLESSSPAADPNGDPGVMAACAGGGRSSGKLRLAVRDVSGAQGGEPQQRCEVTVQFPQVGKDGKERRPEVRSSATAAVAPCSAALAGLEAEFRARIAAAP